ncbi:MAG: hypothetical protein A3G41_07865 [Elusimicrobia bacterium RIFCSPLOWO2_12_FULL_59_9]|nr:MAG: hypothetical protein A3G41_07865 [Elusimicrobia bacterium RIFCSPLOWO2_12_FULL_59_9]
MVTTQLPDVSKKLAQLPPYLFVRLYALKEKAEAKGLKVIDLGQGNPDLPSPDNVVEALCKAVKEKTWTHRYPQTRGLKEFREAVAKWYDRRFGVELDPETEVLPLIGSKEGVAHLFMAYLNPGDTVLVPGPCYPVHYNGVVLAGGEVHWLPLKAENNFLPQLETVPEEVARRAKFLLLNYPNNPTGAVLENDALLKEALAFSERYGAIVVYDNPYSEIAFDGYVAPSYLQLAGAKERGIELHSLSKTYSMAGWRVAFAVGNADIIAALGKFKSFLDYGIPGFLQLAGAEALNGSQDYVRNTSRRYQARRNTLVGALKKHGWEVSSPRAAMYVWAKLPAPAAKLGSQRFAERLITEAGVVLAPGVGFGPHGEGYVRMALVGSEKSLEEAARRIGKFIKGLK